MWIHRHYVLHRVPSPHTCSFYPTSFSKLYPNEDQGPCSTALLPTYTHTHIHTHSRGHSNSLGLERSSPGLLTSQISPFSPATRGGGRAADIEDSFWVVLPPNTSPLRSSLLPSDNQEVKAELLTPGLVTTCQDGPFPSHSLLLSPVRSVHPHVPSENGWNVVSLCFPRILGTSL